MEKGVDIVGATSRAVILLPQSPHYRRDAFAEGLGKLGYEPTFNNNRDPRPGDVLVIWNRYANDTARNFERAKATVLVAENAWVGPEAKDEHHFAICRGHHNGAGTWEVGPEKRWPKMNIKLKPWRKQGSHILVLPQRGMGEKGVAMPTTWEADIVKRLQKITKRPIRTRHHPGPRPHPEIDFDNCWACVIWASGAGVKAIIDGIPVFYEMPKWIGGLAGRLGIEDLENPFLGDRIPMLERLAWAQWRPEEISAGEPFKWLLGSGSTTQATKDRSAYAMQ